jgi:REP element-mobilizing transposase RayT
MREKSMIERRRNSLRYPGYDYSQSGMVFVTLCTHNRQHLFGEVNNGQMVLSGAGEMAAAHWQTLSKRFKGILIDEFVVMPDHLHAILITGDRAKGDTVGFVIRGYKAAVQSAYSRGVKQYGWPPYESHLWQRDYNDRIIRNDAEYAIKCRYIEGNPGRWWERIKSESVGAYSGPPKPPPR